MSDSKKNCVVMQMTENDFDSIKEILNTEFDEFWNETILKSELENMNSKLFIIKEDNNIIGFGGYIITPQDVEITNIVIKKSKRGCGYGNILFEKMMVNAENDAKIIDNESSSISLEVNELNEVAISLYEKHGFQKIGIRKKYYNNTYDAIIMTKNLT